MEYTDHVDMEESKTCENCRSYPYCAISSERTCEDYHTILDDEKNTHRYMEKAKQDRLMAHRDRARAILSGGDPMSDIAALLEQIYMGDYLYDAVLKKFGVK